MSGPKGIRYEIEQERQAIRAATVRWHQLAGRARANAARCAEFGVEDSVTVAIRPPRGSSIEIAAECDRLEVSIEAARARVDATSAERRGKQVAHDLAHALSGLAEREAATPTQRSARREDDLPPRVHRVLASLLEPSPDITESARAILATDPARARLLLADLTARVRAANAHTTTALAERETLAELRAETAQLQQSRLIDIHLRAAAAALDAGRTATMMLAAARRALTEQRDREHAVDDREFVLTSVRETLGELGYTTETVVVETPDSMVLRRAASCDHAVRVAVGDDEIVLRTVRTVEDSDLEADLAADRQLCEDLDGVLAKLPGRGVMPGRVRGAPAGVVPAPYVPTSAPKPAARKRRSTDREAR